LNGVSISLDNVASGDVAAAINAFSTQTGVTVTGTTSLTFSNETGDDIVIADGSTGVLDAAGDETYSSGIKLVTDIGESITLAGTDIADLGFTAGAQTLTTSNLNDTNVLTGDDANDALLTIDFALQQVTGLRAELGSVQVRFESTINNLEITSENMSAARSRIRDADFAAETANLTRVQILQQAGISMLAQANAAPQNVLALLQ
jgi:flagellin